MRKTPPSLAQVGMIAFFVISCFGLGLFLWIAFGGSIPLAPRGYEVKIPFDEATQLADQADVRVSGVPIGKVEDVELDPERGLSVATVSVDAEFAPLPADVRASLREKTLLGETYVELTPGTQGGETLAEGATLPEAQVAETVQLDEILRALDPQARAALQTWMQDAAVAVGGRGRSLSAAFAQLPPFFEGFDRVARTVNEQERAVRELFSRGEDTFDALSRDRGELRGLIEAFEAVASTTAQRDQDLVDAFQAFPTFLEESRLTLARLRAFAADADPLMVQLTPAARELSPTIAELGRLAPDLDRFARGLEPVVDGAPRSFPALRKLFGKDLAPTLDALRPFLRSVNPLLDGVRRYRRELTGLLANAASATNGMQAVRDQARFLRVMNVFSPDAFATFPRRLQSNRANAYTKPGAYGRLAQGLEGFETRQCSGGIDASINPDTPDRETAAGSVFRDRLTEPGEVDNGVHDRDGDDETDTEEIDERVADLFGGIQAFAFGDSLSTAGLPAPPCAQQGPFGPFGAPGDPTTYPHTLRWKRR